MGISIAILCKNTVTAEVIRPSPAIRYGTFTRKEIALNLFVIFLSMSFFLRTEKSIEKLENKINPVEKQ